ncbi:hybrid sensor histidine kinase/response regulator [Skermanella rosea]|uniref:hybrid sensor histidine kinase/response regulator n=1 Tax=Skermanella rosea TaxID=1817965 RepID=UPI00389B005B
MLDPQGIVSSWNPGAERFKGYKAEEIIGQHFSRFYTEEDRQASVPRQALAAASDEGKYETEGWRVRKDGSQFWASVVIDPIRGEHGELLGFAKITRDITERKNAQEALRQSQEQFRLLVQGVTDYAIFMLDPTGRVTNWNSGAERMKGYAAAEIIGQHFSRFYTDEDRAADVPNRALRTAGREGRIEMEGWRVRQDGRRFWANVVIDAIRDETGGLIGFGKVTRDITEQRQAQKALEEAREALFQAQKMEAVGQLTGGVAHDFNNLLQIISSSLEAVEQRLAAGQITVGQHMAAARTAVDRAASLTQRLLAFARRQPLKPEYTNLNALVPGMRDLVQNSVGEAVQVEMRLSEGLWPIRVDANQVESALLNLAINARDAMPDGGRLVFETSNIRMSKADVASESGVAPGDYVMLAVTDTGNGMTPDVLSRAFEPFFTTKPVGQGTGLGLSQVYGFARQSDGCVRLESEVGRGTSVKLYLPRYHGAEEMRLVPQSAPEPQTLVAGAVLVVEDEAILRMLLVEVLEEQGYTVLEAESGNAALPLITSAERIDLLVTDVGLPGINGRQLAEMARSLRPDLKVLFLTGYAYTAMDREVLGPGTELLSKPIPIDRFCSRVRRMLQGS